MIPADRPHAADTGRTARFPVATLLSLTRPPKAANASIWRVRFVPSPNLIEVHRDESSNRRP